MNIFFKKQSTGQTFEDIFKEDDDERSILTALTSDTHRGRDVDIFFNVTKERKSHQIGCDTEESIVQISKFGYCVEDGDSGLVTLNSLNQSTTGETIAWNDRDEQKFQNHHGLVSCQKLLNNNDVKISPNLSKNCPGNHYETASVNPNHSGEGIDHFRQHHGYSIKQKYFNDKVVVAESNQSTQFKELNHTISKEQSIKLLQNHTRIYRKSLKGQSYECNLHCEMLPTKTKRNRRSRYHSLASQKCVQCHEGKASFDQSFHDSHNNHYDSRDKTTLVHNHHHYLNTKSASKRSSVKDISDKGEINNVRNEIRNPNLSSLPGLSRIKSEEFWHTQDISKPKSSLSNSELHDSTLCQLDNPTDMDLSSVINRNNPSCNDCISKKKSLMQIESVDVLEDVQTFDNKAEIETVLSASPNNELKVFPQNILSLGLDLKLSPDNKQDKDNNNNYTKDKWNYALGGNVSLYGMNSKSSLLLNESMNLPSSTFRPDNPRHRLVDSGVGIPDVFLTMKQNIDLLSIFGSETSKRNIEGDTNEHIDSEERHSLHRAFHESISSAVLASLAHKRYERRRLAAMDIEKVVRSLVAGRDHSRILRGITELQRVRAILHYISDDFVRNTSEDARKGGVVALAACAIGLKKAPESDSDAMECRDLILASVVHACQDNSQRVRYYAIESLFNVIKVIPVLAIRHFFILFEILRSLYADVDVDIRSGAELLDKKLREVIVGAVNSGNFAADACVPMFARFLHMRNKPSKRLTLMWLQEFSERLIGSPILEFLHLFLGDVFAMVSDPNSSIRQLSLQFLNSILPKLLVKNEDFEDPETSDKVNFDKILQNLVITMEHPDPFVRKVAMYWMSRIVQVHVGDIDDQETGDNFTPVNKTSPTKKDICGKMRRVLLNSSNQSSPSSATLSVRNSLPHVLPGILLSIGDTFQTRMAIKDSFLPNQTTDFLADKTNSCLLNAVRRDGRVFIAHLDGFIVALREELDTPGGLSKKKPPAMERKPYRMDAKLDGTGIESTGWFRAYGEHNESDSVNGGKDQEVNIKSRVCALEWVITLYEHIVPESLKHEYAEEFITPVIRLLDDTSEAIMLKSLEVLAKITVPKHMEVGTHSTLKADSHPNRNVLSLQYETGNEKPVASHPMTDANAVFALEILDEKERRLKSRNREVFAALIYLQSKNPNLLEILPKIIQYMCTLQPAEFVYVSFGLELNRFVLKRLQHRDKNVLSCDASGQKARMEEEKVSLCLLFVSKFVSVMSHVFLTADETTNLRDVLNDCIANKGKGVGDERKAQLFHILLNTFAHNAVSVISICIWAGAYRTASTYLQKIDPLDITLMFYMELDRLIEFLERPIFRDLHFRVLEYDEEPGKEGSSTMLYRVLKLILMLLPQTTSYTVLKGRLMSLARFRQSTIYVNDIILEDADKINTDVFVQRIVDVRKIHSDSRWRLIRAESLEPLSIDPIFEKVDEGKGRKEWLGYKNTSEVSKESSHDNKFNMCLVNKMWNNTDKMNVDIDSLHLIKDKDDSYPAINSNWNIYEFQTKDHICDSIDKKISVDYDEKKINWKDFWKDTSQ